MKTFGKAYTVGVLFCYGLLAGMYHIERPDRPAEWIQFLQFMGLSLIWPMILGIIVGGILAKTSKG